MLFLDVLYGDISLLNNSILKRRHILLILDNFTINLAAFQVYSKLFQWVTMSQFIRSQFIPTWIDWPYWESRRVTHASSLLIFTNFSAPRLRSIPFNVVSNKSRAWCWRCSFVKFLLLVLTNSTTTALRLLACGWIMIF